MIEHAAFYTDNGKLETAIKALQRTEGRKMWIIAKFISRQLSNSFSSLKIDIDGDDYSKFAESLYKECEDSIYLTSPFTPVEWFRQLYADKADTVIDIIDKSVDITDAINDVEQKYGIPSHVKLLTTANIKTRKRLVILPSGNRAILIAQAKLLQAFLDMNKGVETRFIEKERLCEMYNFACSDQYDFSKYDYAIFDKEIVLKWERPIKPNEKRPLLLIDLKNISSSENKDIYEKIKNDIFEFRQGQHIKKEELKTKIANDKEGLKKSVKEKKELPHKFAYFAAGASSWVTICKDLDYNLGVREITALRKFLEKLDDDLSRSDKWNILHLGSGEGREISPIVDILRTQRIGSYALVDISPELLRLAESFGREKYKDINFTSHALDITIAEGDISPVASALKRGVAHKNLIFLVGNGAIIANGSVFDNVKNSMGHEDRFVLTIETYLESREEEILSQFKIPSIIKLLAEPLSLIGIYEDSPQDFMEFKYNRDQSLVEVYFSFELWVKKYPEKQTSLFQNFPNTFKIFASFRPMREKLEQLLTSKGFIIEKNETFDNEKCCGVMCRV